MRMKDSTVFKPLVIPFPKDPDDLIHDLDDEEEDEYEEGDEDE
jgi:hypothetical protein